MNDKKHDLQIPNNLDENVLYIIKETMSEEDVAEVVRAHKLILENALILKSKGINPRIGFTYPSF